MVQVPPSFVVSFTGCQFDSGFPTRSLSSPTRHAPPADRLTSLTSCKTTDQPEHYDHRTNCYCLYREVVSVLDESLQRRAPLVWNSLSYQSRSAKLFSSFRRILKTELFDIAYSERKQSASVRQYAPMICLRRMALYKFILIDWLIEDRAILTMADQ